MEKKEEKLKTLKEIEEENFTETYRGLRAEAVKWVKTNRDGIHVEITEREFMKFFNLTEKDLK